MLIYTIMQDLVKKIAQQVFCFPFLAKDSETVSWVPIIPDKARQSKLRHQSETSEVASIYHMSSSIDTKKGKRFGNRNADYSMFIIKKICYDYEC